MNIATVFSGIGSPEQGAKRVYKDDFNLVFACEWDKYARESFKANYNIEDKHFHKDITDLNGTQYKNKVDILIGGSPCQDFSLAGLRKGIDGNRGILIYEYFRIIQEVEPPIFIYENVKGMLSDKGGRTIKEFVQAFRDMGYFCHYEVLNTKDYGIPQNRERVFLVGFKDSEHYYNFAFAPKVKIETKLKDILEDDVDEKYYLSEENILKIENSNFTQEKNRIQNNICGTLMARDYKDPKCVKCNDGKIRKLTPREYFRLQDFPESFKFVVSNTQLYKQAGNSISVNAMEMIFNQIEKSRYKNLDNYSLF